RRHTRFSRDWSSDVCSSDLPLPSGAASPMWKQEVARLLFERLQRAVGRETAERTVRRLPEDLRLYAVGDIHGHLDLLESLHEMRSEEHTSELQSRENLVCRL